MHDEQNNTPFRKFWQANGVNLIIGLVITLVICTIVGLRGILMPLPLWLALGIVCWLGRMGLVYRRWKRAGGDQDQTAPGEPEQH